MAIRTMDDLRQRIEDQLAHAEQRQQACALESEGWMGRRRALLDLLAMMEAGQAPTAMGVAGEAMQEAGPRRPSRSEERLEAAIRLVAMQHRLEARRFVVRGNVGQAARAARDAAIVAALSAEVPREMIVQRFGVAASMIDTAHERVAAVPERLQEVLDLAAAAAVEATVAVESEGGGEAA